MTMAKTLRRKNESLGDRLDRLEELIRRMGRYLEQVDEEFVLSDGEDEDDDAGSARGDAGRELAYDPFN